MSVLIDTDVAIEFLRKNPYTLAQIAACRETVLISTITAAELYFGAYNSRRQQENVQKIHHLVAVYPLVNLTARTSQIFGRLKAELRAKSVQVAEFDLLIASLALERRALLATGNTRHFSKIEGLELVNWARSKP